MGARLIYPSRRVVYGLAVGMLVLVPVMAPLAANVYGARLSMEVDLGNRSSLQRGARIFRNYCLSCHSAAHMHYSRVGEDLGLTERVLLENFIFDPSHRIGDPMTVTMDKTSSEHYFGVAAPDLSVIARSRGADWLYTYFKTFYVDKNRPFGVNNLAFRNVSMPHVLWDLQGMQQAIYEDSHGDAKGNGRRKIVGLEQVTPGLQSAEEYDRTVRDLVNFLVYLGEPIKLQRTRFGFWVMVYLFFLLSAVWLLKREYWRDIER